MKKVKALCLVAILFSFALMALGSGSDTSSEKKEIVAADSTATSSDADSKEAETVKEETSASASAVTVEEQLLFEKDGLKVTATEYVVDSLWGDGIKLLIENEGTSDVALGCTAVAVNDYMITDLFSATVAAGKKTYETLTLSSSSLKAAGITEVGKVDAYFYTYDPDTYMTISDLDCITIKTSAYDSMVVPTNDDGNELYNAGGIKIVGKYVDEDSIWGKAIVLYIENNSGKTAIVQCDDLSVNGFMITALMSSTVYDGKKAITDITLLSSDLEENNITDVENVELKFKIIDDNYMNSVESDVISFSTK